MAGVGEVMRGVPVGEMCAHFSVTPKPFSVMLGSALSFSTLAFIADRCRKYDDLLSPVQWALLYYEIGLTTLETAELVLVCLFDDEAALRPFWVRFACQRAYCTQNLATLRIMLVFCLVR